jgi:signal transduction histidine kinase
MEETAIPDVWRLSSADGLVTALYRVSTIANSNRMLLGEADTSARFAIHAPGAATGPDSVPLGPTLPGWQLSLSLADDRPFQEAARRRRTMYLALGSTVMFGIAVSGLLLGTSFRRQMKLTGLKTDLLAAVSHELRTPLASVSLLLENLLASRELEPQKTREYLQLMSGENERLRRLVQNFLAFSRMDRGMQSFRFERTEVAGVVRAAMLSMGERFNDSGCTVEVEEGPPGLAVRGDADALTMAFGNLLDNAWKYTPAEKAIRIRVSTDGENVAVSVSDNGIGIPVSERRKIFRRFYQVDRRLARERGGVGLGLSIVHDVVLAHGGTVNVESETGAGSTFTVRIPRCSAGGDACES